MNCSFMSRWFCLASGGGGGGGYVVIRSLGASLCGWSRFGPGQDEPSRALCTVTIHRIVALDGPCPALYPG